MTKKKRYNRYSPEFKREALKRASEEGVTDKWVCEELGISARQLISRASRNDVVGDVSDRASVPPISVITWSEILPRISRIHNGRPILLTSGQRSTGCICVW